MLASFFYGDWSPDADEAIANLLGLAVAAEVRSTVDAEAAETMLRGYVKVWEGATMEDDYESDMDYVNDPEAFYHKVFLRVFNAHRKRNGYKEKATTEDGVGWFPEFMPTTHAYWPKVLLRKIATTLAEVEADREKATIEYFKKRKAEEAAAGLND